MGEETEDDAWEERVDQDYSCIVGSSVAASATLQGNHIIHLKRRVRDISSNSMKTFSCPYALSDNSIKPLLAPVETAKRVIDSTAPSGLVNVKINDNSSSTNGKCLIEITRDISLERVIDVTEIHGKVMGDAWFGKSGCNHFSNDEKYFVYVAVPKAEKVTSYFDSSVGRSDKVESLFPNKYEYKEDWGEKYTGVSELGLFVLNLESGKVLRIPNVPKDITAGQPIFTPCGRGVVYTAWSNEPKRLGMIYCFQRPCSLYMVSIVKLIEELERSSVDSADGNKSFAPCEDSVPVTETISYQHLEITPQMRQAMYPQFSSNEDDSSDCYLAFLGHETGFSTHNASSGLYCLDWTEFVLISGPYLWDSRNSIMEIDTEKVLRPVIEPGAPTMSTSNRVLVNNFHFPGLFSTSIAPCSFISSRHLLLETNWRAVSVILVVDIDSCELRVISMSDGSLHLSPVFYSSYTVKNQVKHLGEKSTGHVDYATPVGVGSGQQCWQGPTPFSLSLLCACGGKEGGIVLLASNTSTQPRLGFIAAEEILPLLSQSKMSGIMSMIPFASQGRKLSSCFSDAFPIMSIAPTRPCSADYMSQIEVALSQMQSFVLQCRASDDSSVLIESILLLPSKDFPGEGIPLLVVPHGGPHSQFTTAFIAQYAYLSLTLNVAVLMVNYRGSTGYGQKELDSLPGRIGKQDVSDMHSATLAALELNDVQLNSQRLFVAGGSHGGFLTAHLLGQYPSLYRAGALRNPVTNIVSMAMVSDISDWCVVESCGIGNAGVGYDFTEYMPTSSEQINRMYEASPIRYVHHVSAPVLLLLGAKDRRVPVSQGLEYYHTLRQLPARIAAGTASEIRLYPDADHAIDIPDSESDQFISMKKWFAQYI